MIKFASLGLTKITSVAYYRPEDNLGIFDAHDKNLVRAGDLLDFIAETLAAGHSLHAVRIVTTQHRKKSS